MENLVIRYRNVSDFRQEHRGPVTITAAGLVLHFSELSQTFVPYHKVDSVEQTFTSSVPANERRNKSLSSTFTAATK